MFPNDVCVACTMSPAAPKNPPEPSAGKLLAAVATLIVPSFPK